MNEKITVLKHFSGRLCYGAMAGLVLVLAGAQHVTADCEPHWEKGFGLPGVSGVVDAFHIHDDGSGRALYVGGSFRTAGDETTLRIGRWDGSQWTPVGSGLDGLHSWVHALATYDDGTGRALYAAGTFTSAAGKALNRIAKWDGTEWSALADGVDDSWVKVMTVFDDGSGSALYVGGKFASVSGEPIVNLARWDGTEWSAVGSGLPTGPGGQTPTVESIIVFDDGSGPALFAAGHKWDGQTWTAVPGLGTNAIVWNNGTGQAVYFPTAGGIGKWDGTTFSLIEADLNGDVHALLGFNDGSGPALYIGGTFTTLNDVEVNRIAKWDGNEWSALGSGINQGQAQSLVVAVRAMGVFRDASGVSLYAGGNIERAGNTFSPGIARWNGSTWSAVTNGLNNGISRWSLLSTTGWVNTFHSSHDGTSPVLYVGGSFDRMGTLETDNVAMWDGGQWQSLGDGLDGEVNALVEHDDGSGKALYAGGNLSAFNGVAKWDGTQWVSVGSGIGATASISALSVLDDGNGAALYAGGTIGVPSVSDLAKWDGQQWTLIDGAPFGIWSMVTFDDGAGPALYVAGGSGGGFGIVRKWDGATWTHIGAFNSHVIALGVVDLGSGPSLFAGGTFTTAGGVPANRIARWNGGGPLDWSALGSGIGASLAHVVIAIDEFDDGTGPALYAAGEFPLAGGVNATNIAKWDGSNWWRLGAGLGEAGADRAHCLKEHRDASGPALWVGGTFRHAGDVAASCIAKWNACHCLGDLDQDGSVGVSDLLIVLGAWGACADPSNCPADLNFDGVVDVGDLLIILGAWGNCDGSGSSGPGDVEKCIDQFPDDPDGLQNCLEELGIGD